MQVKITYSRTIPSLTWLCSQCKIIVCRYLSINKKFKSSFVIFRGFSDLKIGKQIYIYFPKLWCKMNWTLNLRWKSKASPNSLIDWSCMIHCHRFSVCLSFCQFKKNAKNGDILRKIDQHFFFLKIGPKYCVNPQF